MAAADGPRITTAICGGRPPRSGNYGEGNPVWAIWPMGGAWLCQHLWEHYAFGGDRGLPAGRAYPVMRRRRAFCLDWLVEDEEGHLVTAPSTSPENIVHTARMAAAWRSAWRRPWIWRSSGICSPTVSRRPQFLDVDADFRAELHGRPVIGSAATRSASTGSCRSGSRTGTTPTTTTGTCRTCLACYPGHQMTPETTPELFARRPALAGTARRRGHRLVDGLEDQPVGALSGRRPRLQDAAQHASAWSVS